MTFIVQTYCKQTVVSMAQIRNKDDLISHFFLKIMFSKYHFDIRFKSTFLLKFFNIETCIVTVLKRKSFFAQQNKLMLKNLRQYQNTLDKRDFFFHFNHIPTYLFQFFQMLSIIYIKSNITKYQNMIKPTRDDKTNKGNCSLTLIYLFILLGLKGRWLKNITYNFFCNICFKNFIYTQNFIISLLIYKLPNRCVKEMCYVDHFYVNKFLSYCTFVALKLSFGKFYLKHINKRCHMSSC